MYGTISRHSLKTREKICKKNIHNRFQLYTFHVAPLTTNNFCNLSLWHAQARS